MFLARGYHGASVDAVAREAGFTIGAVYSRFGSKAELFLALLEQRVDERIEQIRSVAAGAGVAAEAAAVARQWAQVLRTDLDWTLLVIEFRVHAARDPVLAARLAEVHARLLRAVVEEHLAGSAFEAAELLGEYVVLASGGSSGALGGAGVAAAEVTVEPVPAIARHPDTGKARRFIPQPAGVP